MYPLYAADFKNKIKSDHCLFQAQIFKISFCVEARRLPLSLAALLQKALSCVAKLTVLPLSATKALSFASMQSALCDKMQFSALLIISSVIESTLLHCSIPF